MDPMVAEIQRGMARIYALHLFSRLANIPDEERFLDNDCAKGHLLWMAEQVIENAYREEAWSVTKLHRWIGYIQGVMTMRNLTSVQAERDDYRRLKQEFLVKLNLPIETDI